jgi:hypothetical protein
MVRENCFTTAIGDADVGLNVFCGFCYTYVTLTAQRSWQLPFASTHAGRTITISDLFGAINGANNILVTTTETIDGYSTYIIRYKYGSVTFLSNGTTWKVVSDDAYVGEEDVLAAASFSGASFDVVLTSWLALGYKSFKFRLDNIVYGGGAGAALYARTSTDGGSSFAATGYKCAFKYNSQNTTSGVWSGTSSPTTTGLEFGYVDDDSGNRANAEVTLFDPEAVGYSIMIGESEYYYDVRMFWHTSISVLETSANVDAIRFLIGTSTFSCNYTVIGRR